MMRSKDKDKGKEPMLNANVNAILGRGTEFQGKLSFEGMVRLDGKFKGEIISNDTLIIGKNAVVEAEIQVSTVLISGQVRGNVFARQKIELRTPGKLYGNIKTPNLILEEGVIFEGNCQMENITQREERRISLLKKHEGDGEVIDLHETVQS